MLNVYNLFKHGGIMEEKRRYERLPIKLMLEVSNLFRQDGISLDLENTEIEVFDISKAGIGFMSEAKLPDNYYFNARIQFETSESAMPVTDMVVNSLVFHPCMTAFSMITKQFFKSERIALPQDCGK